MSQKILVTGASGFLGARIVRKLVEGGHHVKAMVRASSSRRMFAGLPSSQLEVVEGDVTVGHTVYRSLAGCDRLFHVAALTKFWDRNPSAIEEAAVVGTGETLEAARRRHIGDIVYTSSVATLGTTPDQTEMDETKELNLADPDAYVRGKKKAEDIALEHAKETRLVVVQPASIFGPGDWKPTMSGQTILRFLKWNMPIFDFPTIGGGINVVDSDDVAQGHLLALEKGRSGERYILGGENLTYEQVFTILAEITGLPGPGAPIGKGLAMLAARLMELRARMGGPDPEASVGMTRDFVDAYSWVTSAKAEKELGYTHRPARRTLARSVAWYLENGYVTGDDASRIRVDLRAPA